MKHFATQANPILLQQRIEKALLNTEVSPRIVHCYNSYEILFKDLVACIQYHIKLLKTLPWVPWITTNKLKPPLIQLYCIATILDQALLQNILSTTTVDKVHTQASVLIYPKKCPTHMNFLLNSQLHAADYLLAFLFQTLAMKQTLIPIWGDPQVI